MCKKSHRHSGKRLTEAIYTEVAAKVKASKVTKHRVSVSGMLKVLGVSRSGYRAFQDANCQPLPNESIPSRRRFSKSTMIQSRITVLQKSPSFCRNPKKPFHNAPSVNTCVKWALGHNGQNHGLLQQKTLTLAVNFITFLMNSLILSVQMPYGVLTLHIYGLRTVLCTLTV